MTLSPPLSRRLAQNFDLTVSTAYPAGDKPDPTGDAIELQLWPDFPLARGVGSTTGSKFQRANPLSTYRREFWRHGHVVLDQGLGALIQSQRADTYTDFMAWRAEAQTYSHIFTHRLFKNFEYNRPSNADGDRQTFEAVWDSGLDRNLTILTKADGSWILAEGEGAQSVAINYGEPMASWMANRVMGDWADTTLGGTGVSNTLRDVRLHFMSDSKPDVQGDRQGAQLHIGTHAQRTSATELEISPAWSFPTNGLTPDGDGFYDLRPLYDNQYPRLVGVLVNNSESYGGFVLGVKNSGGRTVVRWDSSDLKVTDGVGDTIRIFNGDRSGYEADWGTVGDPFAPPDGINEFRNIPEQAEIRAEKVKQELRAFSEICETLGGFKGMRHANGANTTAGTLDNGTNQFRTDNPFNGFFDLYTYENFESDVGIEKWGEAGSFINVLNFYDPDTMMRRVLCVQPFLDKTIVRNDPVATVTGSERFVYPMHRIGVELGGPDAPSGDPEDKDTYEAFANNREIASLGRFFAVMQPCLEHALLALGGAEKASDPWLVEEQFYWPGLPMIPALGSRDPATYDQATHSIQWKTPDFGTHGYVYWFGNSLGDMTGVIAINYADPGSGQYAPGYGLQGDVVQYAGQDLDTYAQANFGRRIRMYDSATYTVTKRPAGDPTLGFRPGQNAGLLKDPLINDGQLYAAKFPAGLRLKGLEAITMRLEPV